MTRAGFIGVICGLKSEARAVRTSGIDRSKFRIGISGANAQRAEQLAQEFCEQGARAILSVGISGGLDPELEPGDLVIGEAVNVESGVYSASLILMRALVAVKLPSSRRARLFGSDQIIADTSRKGVLFRRHAAVAVDMESHGAARAAARFGVPFAAIRTIADPADRALPPAALNAVAPDGSTRVIMTLLRAVKSRGQLSALVQLGKDSAIATKTLRRDLPALFAAAERALEN